MPNHFEKLSHPENADSVSPHDTNELSNHGILYVGGAGNIAVTTAGGDDVTFSGVTAGSFVPVKISKVMATGTTASNILVLY